MASNPNRPQYQGTIESTWGQSVADHVIRRYASPAERDADLTEAGLTAEDLEGQVVAITGAGRPPFLELAAGNIWRGVTGYDIQAGSTHAGCDSNAWAAITFPRPFAGKPVFVWSDQSASDSVNNLPIGFGCVVGLTAVSAAVRCQGTDGQPIIGSGVQIGWVAMYAGAQTLLNADGEEIDSLTGLLDAEGKVIR